MKLLFFLLMLSIVPILFCLVGQKTPYDQAIDDNEQEKAIKGYQKNKE